ncbi:MAG TPA: dienelactone hydrolase family protein [Lysobacter sp.]
MSRSLVALCLMLLASPAFAATQAKPVEWKIGEEIFSGVLVYDDTNAIKRPGLVMVPNWMGVRDLAVDRAREIAGDDYVVLVADVYGKDVRPKDKAEAKAQVMKTYADGGATLRKRVAAAVDALKAQAGDAPLDASKLGALGFCFGGNAVLELARTGADLAGVVSIHGGLDTYLPTEGKIRTPVLVLNGAADTSVPDEQIVGFEKEMDVAGADWQLVDFGGARHCFSQAEDANADPKENCQYNERAAKRAFEMMNDFFRERFAAN